MMSGVRPNVPNALPAMFNADVAIRVRGHKALTAMPLLRSSAARPKATMLMLYLDTVYAACDSNHLACRLMGGDKTRIWGLAAFSKNGKQACEHMKVPRCLGQVDGTGVVNQDVDATKMRSGFGYRFAHIVFVSHVHNQGQGLAACCLDFGSGGMDGARQAGIRL